MCAGRCGVGWFGVTLRVNRVFRQRTSVWSSANAAQPKSPRFTWQAAIHRKGPILNASQSGSQPPQRREGDWVVIYGVAAPSKRVRTPSPQKRGLHRLQAAWKGDFNGVYSLQKTRHCQWTPIRGLGVSWQPSNGLADTSTAHVQLACTGHWSPWL